MGLYPCIVHACIVHHGVPKLNSVFNLKRDSKTLNILSVAGFVGNAQKLSTHSGVVGLPQIALEGPEMANCYIRDLKVLTPL